MTPKIAASVLGADIGRLGDQVAEAEAAGVDWLHVDVMDGHFVPNLSFGPAVVAAARKHSSLPVDVHLMIESPDRYLDAFVAAGAHRITVHVEACRHLHRTVQQISQLGAKPGVAANPATPAALLAEIAPFVELILVMTVNPGFGGQAFIPQMLHKVRDVRRMLSEVGAPGAELQVDGGIASETVGPAVRAGATVLVAGSAIFGDGSTSANVRALRAAVDP